MANNDLTNNEKILVKVDQNNLILIDPNSTVSNGIVEPRATNAENYVYYVNLEADLIPRTTLVSGEQNTLSSVAEGTLNFLQNKNSEYLDTTWTDTYNPRRDSEFKRADIIDDTGQAFGIQSIDIQVRGTNFVPKVTIKFVDVRGKTLFESPKNSPYQAFFHQPWPIFYLTVKGFYGKAMRYRLHMTDFNSSYNDGNGNFESVGVFIGSTYAYLSDIPLKGILNAPYMYGIEQTKDTKTNEKTGEVTKVISKTSKGYLTLKSIFEEYKRKGLIDDDMPVKTLKEVIDIAKRLDPILEKKIFGEVVDMKIFVASKEMSDQLRRFFGQVQAWQTKNLTPEFVAIPTGSDDPLHRHFFLTKTNNNTTESIIGEGKGGTLESIILQNLKSLGNSEIFGKETQKTTADFKKLSINLNQSIKDIGSYYSTTNGAGKVTVAIDKLFDDMYKISNSFQEELTKLQDGVEFKMNEVISGKDGIGFEPTIRNIVAIILASADTYIRLLKSVHLQAYNVSEERKTIIKGFTNESVGDAIYPWPEIKKQSTGTTKVLAYPAESDLIQKLRSDDMTLWPEVQFVEEYAAVSTQRTDNQGGNESDTSSIRFEFGDSNNEEKSTNRVSTFDVLPGSPYSDKNLDSFLYEIYERSQLITLYDTFNGPTLNELGKREFETIQNLTGEDYFLIDILRGSQISSRERHLELMRSFSPYERYPYHEDNQITVPYLLDNSTKSFTLKDYTGEDTVISKNGEYEKLQTNLDQYISEEYRSKIYPFNSDTYLGYLNKTTFAKTELNVGNALSVDTGKGFINSPVSPRSWTKGNQVVTNMFNETFSVENTTTKLNILNTPYFHKSIYEGFLSGESHGKYKSSAYLLLNSLPFKDLKDTIEFIDINSITPSSTLIPIFSTDKVLMSSLFREIGSTHYVPYHLILKWGSIYHRYKEHIINNVDILSGLDTPIDGDEYFDNSLNLTFASSITRSSQTDVGIHPRYSAVYHQVVNGYLYYNVNDTTPTSFDNVVGTNTLFINAFDTTKGKYYNSFVDNSRFTSTDLRLTILPSTGTNIKRDLYLDFNDSEQFNFRVNWVDNQSSEFIVTGKTLPTPMDYFGGMSTNNEKVIDLIGTFSPDILTSFEEAFLDFSSEVIDSHTPYKKYETVYYPKFQDLLKEIVTVEKKDSDVLNTGSIINTISLRQEENQKKATENILTTQNMLELTITNPKELNPHILNGYINFNSRNLSVGEFQASQVSSNSKYIELYIGEDIDGNYLDFFNISNIELSEENVFAFRPIVQIYGGYKKSGGVTTKTAFIEYLTTSIVAPQNSRQSLFLSQIYRKLPTLERLKDKNNNLGIIKGYNEDTTIKLELYNDIKSLNDKWISGNSMGQRLLMEEFMFLDKANKDIGDELFIDLKKLIQLGDTKNSNIDLYSTIGILIAQTGIDMRVLPAYINFYANESRRTRVKPSDTIASVMFGKFLEVDTEYSTPKAILQYVSGGSKHLNLSDINDKYMYKDDGVDLESAQDNPILITDPDYFNNSNLSKSNKVVAFEVSFGDQNQQMFKGISLDQKQFKNTYESNLAMERLAKSQSGSGVLQVDTSLFDIYRTRSYSCTVTAMGNAMIQPTMYFQLKNVPLFAGAYWIVEVSHAIANNSMTTTFKGVRMPKDSLPNPKDSFIATYRVLFDKILKRAVAKQKQIDDDLKSLANDEGKLSTVTTKDGTFSTDYQSPIKGETLLKEVGYSKFGIPFNGKDNNTTIQKIKYTGNNTANHGTWLRARVDHIGAHLSDSNDLSLVNFAKQITVNPSKMKWSEIKGTTNTKYFFTAPYNMNVLKDSSPLFLFGSRKTTFYNPNNNLRKEIPHQSVTDQGLGPVYTDRYIEGPIDNGSRGEYGITMSKILMKDLKLSKGDVIYFLTT